MMIDNVPIAPTYSRKTCPRIGEFAQAREYNATDWFPGRGVCPANDPERNRTLQDEIRSCVPCGDTRNQKIQHSQGNLPLFNGVHPQNSRSHIQFHDGCDAADAHVGAVVVVSP
jgi:hypothetical protein